MVPVEKRERELDILQERYYSGQMDVEEYVLKSLCLLSGKDLPAWKVQAAGKSTGRNKQDRR